ncbi:MAG: hypothetical protein ACTSVY_15775 [Candidatus Helarchaeota archaeon]
MAEKFSNKKQSEDVINISIKFFDELEKIQSKKGDEYLNRIQSPKIISKILSSFTNILILSQFKHHIQKNFTELKNNLKWESSVLGYKLKKLIKNGVLKKKYVENRINNKFSFYSLTNLGKFIVDNLFV